jgi:hypothetical protein
MQKEITTVLCSLTPIEPDRPGQVGPAQVRARELRSGEVGPHQFWPGDGELPPVAIPIVCTVLKSG